MSFSSLEEHKKFLQETEKEFAKLVGDINHDSPVLLSMSL